MTIRITMPQGTLRIKLLTDFSLFKFLVKNELNVHIKTRDFCEVESILPQNLTNSGRLLLFLTRLTM